MNDNAGIILLILAIFTMWICAFSSKDENGRHRWDDDDDEF